MKKVKFIEIKSELEGWEYCGYVPNVTRGTGNIETLSLIFQKEEKADN